MDLHLFARVLWRFKYLVGVGVIVAVALSVLTVAKIDPSRGAPFLKARATPLYASSATILVTQHGFPWGSAVQQYSSSGTTQDPVPAGDLARLTALANLYVQLANSDAINRTVMLKAPGHGTIMATQNYSISPSYYSTALPIVTITGTSTTPGNAIATAELGVTVLTDYLTKQQQAANISASQRVVVQQLQAPRKTVVVDGTKKTLPIVVFLTVMLAVIGLAFVLENLRPIRPAVLASTEVEPLIDSARRTA